MDRRVIPVALHQDVGGAEEVEVGDHGRNRWRSSWSTSGSPRSCRARGD
jgi:hypothetical protein